MTCLVYLSPVPWASFAQRPHKFVKWYHNRTGNSVLWVEPYATRLPKLKDFKRLRISREKCSSESPPKWLDILSVGGIPVEPLPVVNMANSFLWRKACRNIAEFANGSGALIVIGKPSEFALQLLRYLKPDYSIYDAMDNFPAFYRGLSRISITRKEALVVESVDLVITSSTNLMNHWGSSCKEVQLVRNGLDFSMSKGIVKQHESRKKKVFGYVGTIAEWFDWEWLVELAICRPKDDIRLIGPCFEESPIKLPSNIVLYSELKHEAALVAMSLFDVGLIPFKKTELTESVDPIKYYEYRSLSLPVISTNFGEMKHHSQQSGVFLSYDTDDIECLALEALSYHFETGLAEDFSSKNTWDFRFDKSGILEKI